MRAGITSLAQHVSRYRNTAGHNDDLYREMTAATWSDPLLAAHRRHVEANDLGFGDAAFHALWSRLLVAAAERFGRVRALEIGVFKGQVISLWSALAREADDASCDLSGTAFWKGHDGVSRAAQVIPSLGFRNVLNVGHNRVFERTRA